MRNERIGFGIQSNVISLSHSLIDDLFLVVNHSCLSPSERPE